MVLNTVWSPWWTTTVFCFVIVCSEQLNYLLFFRKILHVLRILQFPSIFCIFEPFPAVTVWFWDQRTTEWLKHNYKNVSIIHWYSRGKRFGVSKCFLYWWNIFYFLLFSTALRKQQNIFACFPEDKLSTIYLDLQIQKSIHTPGS